MSLSFYSKNAYPFLITLVLTACMVGPDFEEPDAPKVSSYTEKTLTQKTVTAKTKGGAAQTFLIGKEIPAQWWTLFHSAKLNHVMKRALKNSPNLKSAVLTLQSAEKDLQSLVGASMYPNVSGNIGGGREQLSALDSLEGSPGTTLSDFPVQLLSLYNATVQVSYVLDVFGGNRRAIEALAASVDYDRFQVEATYLTLAGNIATTAITEAGLREQIAITQQMIKTEADQLMLMKKQNAIGTITDIDLLTQETVLAQTSATLPPLENSLAQSRHALAALVGDFSGDKTLPYFYLDDFQLPTELPLSVSSQLVRQRPDIQAAEALVHQASADLGVAIADLLPTFPITGFYGVNSDTMSNFFNPSNVEWFWDVQVLQPLFAGGSLVTARDSARFAFEAAFEQYRQTVLYGFQNVADSLSALETDAEELKETAIAENAAEKTWILTQKQYDLGASTLLDVLTAKTTYQETSLDRVASQTSRFADTAALFQALGGGWWNKEPEDEDKEK